MTMYQELLRETEERMRQALDALKSDLRTIRTGRATPALLERVMVDYYGQATPLNQLAVISAPEPSLLVVRPYDPQSLEDIERGILRSDVGLTPSNDGRMIRLPIPRLTEERREDLAKMVRQRAEEGKVALRNIRRDALGDLRELEEEKLISEDEFYRAKDELQDLIDTYTEKMEEVSTRKQRDVRES